MNCAARRYEVTLFAAVYAVAAAFWLVVFAMSEPPEFRVMYVYSAIMVAVVATPWAFAARLLFRDWWAAAELNDKDGAAQLLLVAAATLPEARRDWGAAMAAELAQLRGHSERWHFAAGCTWAILFSQRCSWAAVIVVAIFAAVSAVITSVAVGRALTAMQTFLTTFVAIVGALALSATVRAGRLRLRVTAPTGQVAGVAAVAACIASTAFFLIRNPEATENFSPIVAVCLAGMLAGCLWLSLLPPRVLTTDRVGRGIGIAIALVFGMGFVWIARLSVHTYGGPIIWILFAPVVLFFAAGAAAAVFRRSFRAGVQAAAWATMLGTLLVFALSLPEAMHRYAIDGRTLGDGESGYSIGVNLPGAVWCLVQIPAFGLSFGVIGAAVGRRLRGTLPYTRPNSESVPC